MKVTKEVFVFTLTKSAAKWLESHSIELESAFLEAHRSQEPEVGADHPHRLGIMKGDEAREEFNPDDPPVYIYVPAHWSGGHLRRTRADITRVLRQLGADLSEFEI